MPDICVSSRPLIKVNGFFRTGTNWLVNLLYRNVPDALVMQHTLGSKHEMPVAPKDWINGFHSGCKRCITEFSPADLQDVENRLDQVNYIVIVKHPFSWAESFRRYKPIFEYDRLWAYIDRYNRCYRAWRDCAQSNPMRWAFVRYFDLLADTELTLNGALRGLIGRKIESFVPVEQTVDHRGRLTAAFSKCGYYLQARYMNDLPNSIKVAIRDLIDWDLFKLYGYEVSPPCLEEHSCQ